MDVLDALIHAQEEAASLSDPLTETAFLATVSPEGAPELRAVHIGRIRHAHLELALNATSAKWRALVANPAYELLFFWKRTGRQFRLRGARTLAPEDIRAERWAGMTPASRAIEWLYERAHPQSSPIASREALLDALHRIREEEKLIASPPPSFLVVWLVPNQIEVWAASPADRLHVRRRWRRSGETWQAEDLVP